MAESAIESTARALPPDVYRRVLEGMPESLVLVDRGGVIRLWNPASEALFGYSAEEAVGATLDLIVPERFKAAHDAGFARAVASGQLRVAGRVMRTRASPKDGRKLYVDFTFSLLKDDGGAVTGVYAIARDATEAQVAQGAKIAAAAAQAASGSQAA
jgi:PAS domain S-box-containing protein